MNTKTMFSSESVEWETPQDIFDKLNSEFHFTLDPCATKENHKCDKYYTKEENGLLQKWNDNVVFCNPPYGKEIKHWIAKCFLESKNATIVALLPARTDTSWFHDYIYNKAEIRFIKGRLKFGNSKNSAPFPSMIVIFNNG